MLKLIGAVLVILGSGILGVIIASNFSTRPILLRQLQSGLQMLETEIVYSATPLPYALHKVGNRMEKPLNQIFFHTSSLLTGNQGFTAGEAWYKTLENQINNLAIDESDLNILKSFGWYLGESDKEEQIKNIRLTLEQLKQEEIKAERSKERNQKLCHYLGFTVGITLAILLL